MVRKHGGKLVLGVLCLALASTFIVGGPGAQAAPSTPPGQSQGRADYRSDELLVKFKPGTPAADQAAAHRQAGGQVDREIAGLDVKVVKVKPEQLDNRLRAYQANPNVEFAELNGIAYAEDFPQTPPGDPLYSRQWGLNNTANTRADVAAPQAWATGAIGSSNVRIAIIDTGVLSTHPDLSAKVDKSPEAIQDGNLKYFRNWTTTGDTTQAEDGYGHGTHVAGIAAASTNNLNVQGTYEGVAGICPNCLLTVGKVLDDNGSGAYDWIANGVLWAVGCEIRDATGKCLGPMRAQVINLSLGGTYNSIALQQAVDKAWSRGAVLTCAAGNNGNNVKFYPAAYTNCIAVGATDSQDLRASFSNYGAGWVDVAAPGVNIWSTLPTSATAYSDPNGYNMLSGTSMAAPHVAGLAGLLWSKGGAFTTPTAVRSRIESTTDRVGLSYWSKGRINACRAVGGSGC